MARTRRTALIVLGIIFWVATPLVCRAQRRTAPAGDPAELRSRCYTPGPFPKVHPDVSPERKSVMTSCTELIMEEPANPLPYYYRAEAGFMGFLFGDKWNSPPYFSTYVASDPRRLVEDYETALRLSTSVVLPEPDQVHRKLGYAYASVSDWAAALKNWREALKINPNLFDLREKMDFAQARLIAVEKLARSVPAECSELSYWDCLLINGCVKGVGPSHSYGNNIGTADNAYKGCKGTPKGLKPDARGPDYDCSLFDSNHCGMAGKCRWHTPLWRDPACIPLSADQKAAWFKKLLQLF